MGGSLKDRGPRAGCPPGRGHKRGSPRNVHGTPASHLNCGKKLLMGSSFSTHVIHLARAKCRFHSGTKPRSGVGNRQAGRAALQSFRSQQERWPSKWPNGWLKRPSCTVSTRRMSQGCDFPPSGGRDSSSLLVHSSIDRCLLST